MTVDEGLITYLLAQTPVTDEVSTRVYAGYAPQDAARPLIIVRIAGAQSGRHATAADGLLMAQMEVICQGLTYKTARDIAEGIRTETDGFRGSMSSVVVRFCSLEGIRDTSGDPRLGDEVGYPSVTVDLDIMRLISVPTFS